MTPKAILSGAALAVFASAASAATQVPLPAGYGDAAFNAACAAGGDGNRGCETAVVELRGGDGDGGGAAERELKIEQVFEGRVIGLTESQFALDGGESYAFSIDFDAAADRLSFTFGGTTVTRSADLAGTRSVFIRNRSGDRGALTLSNLVADGVALGGLGPDGTSYLALGGFDPDRDFSLTGDAVFAFDDPNQRIGSRLAAQVKFTDLDVAPIPLPAGGVLLLTGLAGLGAMRRRAAARAA